MKLRTPYQQGYAYERGYAEGLSHAQGGALNRPSYTHRDYREGYERARRDHFESVKHHVASTYGGNR